MNGPLVRADIRDALWRWREVLVALGVAALGVWLGLVAFGILAWLGWGIGALGVALAVAAAQKVRFTPDGDGAGVVTLDERRVTYLGPQDGGVIDLDLMVQLDLTPAPAWRLISGDGTHLDIPTNALGVEVLFDVFTALPGMRTEHMLAVLKGSRPALMTVWMAPGHRPYTLLH